MYRYLVLYHAMHGHSSVPYKFRVANNEIALGRWVHHQRHKHKTGKLSADKICQLDKVNFEWTVIDRNNQSWEAMFERLVEYKREFQHCNVPRLYKGASNTEGPSLGKW